MTRKRSTRFDYTQIDAAKSLDELRALRDELSDYGTDLTTRAEAGDQLPDGEIRAASDGLTRIDEKIDAAELSIQTVRNRVESGDAVQHSGTTTDTPSPTRRKRDDVTTSLERSVSDGLVTEDAATRIERAAGHSDAMATLIRTTGTEAYTSAFEKVMASERGHLSLTDAERRAYQSAHEENRSLLESNTGSAAILPFQLDPAIILSSGGSTNPFREVSRNVTTSTNAWRGITSAGVQASWTPEATEVGDNSPTLANPEVRVHKATAFVPYSFEVEQDAAGQFIAELQVLLLDAVDQLEAAAFATGSGVAQPKGIVTALAAANPSVLVPATTPETVSAADLYAVSQALPPRFRAGARWALNLNILNLIRQMETGNGALKFPELANGSLLSKPVSEVSTLDGALNPAATETNYAAIYGDFQQFVIVNKLGSVVEFVPQLFGPNGRPTGQRGLLLHFRTGSDVLVPNAFRVLSVPTTA